MSMRFSKKSARRPASRPRAAFEQLEDRRLLSATGTAFIRGDVLHVRGTPAADAIGVSTNEQQSTTTVTINGTEFTFSRTAWKQLRVVTGKGNDVVEAGLAFPPSTTTSKATNRYYLGSGDDQIQTSRVTDVVYGEAGDDVIRSAFGGKDVLVGGNGRDLAEALATERLRGVEVVSAISSPRDPFQFFIASIPVGDRAYTSDLASAIGNALDTGESD